MPKPRSVKMYKLEDYEPQFKAVYDLVTDQNVKGHNAIADEVVRIIGDDVDSIPATRFAAAAAHVDQIRIYLNGMIPHGDMVLFVLRCLNATDEAVQERSGLHSVKPDEQPK